MATSSVTSVKLPGEALSELGGRFPTVNLPNVQRIALDGVDTLDHSKLPSLKRVKLQREWSLGRALVLVLGPHCTELEVESLVTLSECRGEWAQVKRLQVLVCNIKFHRPAEYLDALPTDLVHRLTRIVFTC